MPLLSRAVEVRQIFQALSYLQYPIYLVTLVYMALTGWALLAVRSTGWGPVLDGA
jgi:hypothetical protein